MPKFMVITEAGSPVDMSRMSSAFVGRYNTMMELIDDGTDKPDKDSLFFLLINGFTIGDVQLLTDGELRFRTQLNGVNATVNTETHTVTLLPNK